MKKKVGFHGNIALPLETLTNSYMKRNGYQIIVTADIIEVGSFVSIMLFLLCHKYGRTEDVIVFLNEVSKYIGLSGREIPFDEAVDIFEKFKKLFDEKI